MRFPQLLVYETAGRLAQMLEGTAGTHRWSLRQPRQLDACLRLLRQGGPAIIVIRLGSELEGALTLVERTTWLFPDVATVVVADSDTAVLVDMAWDLGARYVFTSAQPRELLLDVVASLMGHEHTSDDPARSTATR